MHASNDRAMRTPNTSTAAAAAIATAAAATATQAAAPAAASVVSASGAQAEDPYAGDVYPTYVPRNPGITDGSWNKADVAMVKIAQQDADTAVSRKKIDEAGESAAHWGQSLLVPTALPRVHLSTGFPTERPSIMSS